MNKTKIQVIIKFFVVIFLCYQFPIVEDTILSSTVSKLEINENQEGNVYIYNTHQGEEYIGYDVMLGAEQLQSSLQQLGYICNREETSIENYLQLHALDYTDCYTVSQLYLEQELETGNEYDLIIDFHRDSIDKDLSTISYDGKDYAKIMFVVGQGSDNFEKVNALSETLSDYANQEVTGISRGIMLKQSDYNQGTSDNIVLIEVGAYKNTKEEVENTIDVLTKIIDRYLKTI